MSNLYTVVLLRNPTEGRDDSCVETIRALTPTHAAWILRHRLAKAENGSPDIYAIIAVFEGSRLDRYEPLFDTAAYMEILDQELKPKAKIKTMTQH